MASPSLVREVQALSKSVADVLTRLPSVPHESLFEEVAGAKPVNAFLFEVKVMFTLLAALSSQGWAIRVENLDRNRVRLPRSAGLKQRFSYFVISHPQGSHWHLVHGTKIETDVDTKIAPDLSLQAVNAGNRPRAGHVKAMWDAKWRKRDDSRVRSEDYSKFVCDRDNLQVPRPGLGDPLQGWPPAFEVSGLISNGVEPIGSMALFLKDGVSITQKFGNEQTRTKPTRAQHLSGQIRTASG